MQGKLYINGAWHDGQGEPFESRDPATGAAVWSGRAADASDVDRAVRAARAALPAWSALPLDERIERLEFFASRVKLRQSALAETIARETGKPLWEAEQEVGAMANKIALSVRAHHERRAPVDQDNAGVHAALRFKPHGVVAVLGPFNLPGHLPNGHIVPALLAGNTVVFKPSEKTPGVGEATLAVWDEVGLPPGTINLVQGMRETGAELVEHPGIDGVYFTGGTQAGLAIARTLVEQPGRIVALEMGGNNPLVVHEARNLDAAALITIQSAYLTAGQRCTCARRLILIDGNEAKRFIERLVAMIGRIRVGKWDDQPPPFMGPVVSPEAATKLLDSQEKLIAAGADSLVRMQSVGETPAMLRPGLIDVTNVTDRPDVELFGPILQVIRVRDFAAAIEEANRTRYGLVAGLISDRRDLFDQFFQHVRAGLINWNRPTNGASGALPFGGVGMSGNHRPAGYWSSDYVSYPVASLQSESLTMPAKPPPGIEL